MKSSPSLIIGLCLFSLVYSAKQGKISFPDRVQKVPLEQPQKHAVEPVPYEPDSITIEIPSNAENVKHEGDVQKINYEPDKGHLALEYQKRLVDDYYWPIPMGYGFGYAYPPPTALANGYNALGNYNYANQYLANPAIYGGGNPYNNYNGVYGDVGAVYGSYPNSYSANSLYNNGYNTNPYLNPYVTYGGNQYNANRLYNANPNDYSTNGLYNTYSSINSPYYNYPYTTKGNSYNSPYGPYNTLYASDVPKSYLN